MLSYLAVHSHSLPSRKLAFHPRSLPAGIYEPSELCSPDDRMDPTKTMQNCVVNVCQPGSGLLAAGYCLYSSSVIFMLSIGTGCYGFTYDSLVGEFILTHPDLKVRP
jgi:fructose-1,6-bisphosphatase I